MSTTGVERDGHFIGALKWGRWCVGGVGHSQPAEARLEVQMSARGHFVGGVEVEWGWFMCQMRTGHCSRAMQMMSTVGVEHDGHFIGALKWGGWHVGGFWHSRSVQARLEARVSTGHFIEALKWEGV